MLRVCSWSGFSQIRMLYSPVPKTITSPTPCNRYSTSTMLMVA